MFTVVDRSYSLILLMYLGFIHLLTFESVFY